MNAPPAAAQATPKAVSAGTGETSPLSPGWTDVDQRMVFLTVQLSTVESTIAATNKSLKIHGYEQAHRQNDADNAAKANERMDRNGGAPVSWQDFYGQTAEKFFYHPTDNNTIHINPDAVAQRPPQFDYIYRANDQRMENAQADVQKIGGKIEDLLSYRRQLESEQSALWAKIAFRGDSSLNIGARPLYRLDLARASDDATGRQYAAAANASVAFMNAIDRELADAQKTLSTDQTQAFDRLLATTAAAHANASRALLGQPALSADLDDPRTPLGRFSRAAKRLEDSAQNISDAIRLAADCDGKDDQSGKQVYRGQLQRMIFDYSSSFVTADQAVTDMVAGWKLKEVGTLRPAPSTPAAAGDGDAMTQLESAKYAQERAVAAAHRSIGAAIDSRLDAAADAGDLATVQSLAAAKVTVARDGSLPDDVKDPAVLDAARQAQQQISTASGTLGAAYRTAVATLTRQRKFSDAQIVQDELNAFLRNSNAPPAGDSPVAGASPAAGGSLPPVSPAAAPSKIIQFGRAPAAGWQYDNQFEVRSDGILLPEQHYVRSAGTDFLEKDFRLDVWITIDPKYPSTYIGLGSAQNGPHASPVNSIYMVINSDGRISMATREGYGDAGMGKEEDAGKYVMRLEKIGLTVTYSIGTLDKSGNFQTDVTQTFSDITKTPADFNNRNMHVFFGGGMLHQMRFTLLPPGSQPQSSIDAPQLSKVASLSAVLPKYFECATSYSITGGGMELPVGHFIRTRASDYLDRDFTFDVWLSVNEKDKSGGMIGLGTGLDDQGGTPENSVFLKINHRSPDLNIRRSGTRAGLNRHNLESGEYMARIEKKGLTVTFSLGVEENGVFKSEYTRTVPDINNTSDAHFTNRNMHLFFGAGCFTRFRFLPAMQVEQNPGASAGAKANDTPADKASAGDGHSTAPITKLGARLPSYLTCRDSFNTAEDGIVLPENTYIITRDTNFLEQDFVFDLWMTIDPKQPVSFIGLGSGQDGPGAIPEKSLSMLVNHFSNGGLQVVGDTFNAEDFGRETDPGDYMVRVEKVGNAVTFSIGVEKDGRFSPDFSRAFPDITQTCPNFNNHNVHLFFRGGQYKQIRLTRSASATAPQPASAGNLVVISAKWGGGKNYADVTQIVIQLFASGKDFRANTIVLHVDPTPGWRKNLQIIYTQNGTRHAMSTNEDSLVEIPASGASAAAPLQGVPSASTVNPIPQSSASTQPTAANAIVPKGPPKCTIANASNGQLITMGGPRPGDWGLLRPASGADDQRFTMEPIYDGQGIRLVAQSSGLLLGIREGSLKPGAEAIQWDSREVDERRSRGKPLADRDCHWTLEGLSDGAFKITNAHSGLCLTAEAATPAKTAAVKQEVWNSLPTQEWRIDPDPSAPLALIAPSKPSGSLTPDSGADAPKSGSSIFDTK